MKIQFAVRDKNRIQKAIRKKYKKVAKNPDGFFRYPTGKPGLEALQYDKKLIGTLPGPRMEGGKEFWLQADGPLQVSKAAAS